MYTLICIDFINEMMSSEGKFSGKGYLDYAKSNQSIEKIKAVQNYFRQNDWNIVHVRVGFDSDYKLQPKNSPLFGKADAFDALKLGSFGTEFLPALAPKKDEFIITKHRVSAFYQTNLALTLKQLSAKNIVICGLSTDLSVSKTASDAHDRDYHVTVLEDCCVAACDSDHKMSISLLKKLADVTTSKSFMSK